MQEGGGDRKLAASGAGSVTQALQSRSPWDEYQASKDDAPMTRGTAQHHWTPAFQDSNEWDAGRMLAFGPRHVHAGESGKSQLMVFVRSFSTTSRPALRAAACGGRPRAGNDAAAGGEWPHPSHQREPDQYRVTSFDPCHSTRLT